ncbi:MAG: FAD-dependent oxidoreductase [Chloroflexi bacterium]|nr:FAD-dependent oxidoreductase [Chloroflexota bacterium]
MIDNSPEHVVVVGSGLAGLRACQALRSRFFSGKITLIGAEQRLPYDRPPLSKGFLQGKQAEAEIGLISEQELADLDLAFYRGVNASQLDLALQQVVLSNRENIKFDRLILATGSYNRRLPIPGIDLEGVFSLRTLDDAVALRATAEAAAHIVIIGAGFIGCEVAASLSGGDGHRHIDVVEALDVPLKHVCGPEVGIAIQRLHETHGVRIFTNASVAMLQGDGHVERVVLTDGRTLSADLVIVAVGAAPAIEWLRDLPFVSRAGVEVDASLQTPHPNVYAIGDIARFPDPLTGQLIRVEHWEVARAQGLHVAGIITQGPQPYRTVPYFWSDQYDRSFQYVGHATQWDRVIVRGDLDTWDFLAFYVYQNRLLAILACGRTREFRFARQLVERQIAVDLDALPHASVDLRQLAARG